jgi:hypothetical protein
MGRRKVRHGKVMPGAECGHRTEAVVGGDVGKDHPAIFLHATLGNEFFGEAGRHLEHLVATEWTPSLGTGHEGIEIRLFPL